MKPILLIISITFVHSYLHGQENLQRNIDLYTNSKTTNLSLKDLTKVSSFSVYGGGSLFGILTNDPESKADVGPSGSLGLNLATSRASYNLYYSYNDKEVFNITSVNALGSILMNPNTTGQSFSFAGTAALCKLGGLCLYSVVVDNTWQIDSFTTVDASPIMLKGGIYLSPFDFSILTENTAQFIIKLQYAHRSILGDFNNEARSFYGQSYTNRGYNGFDVSLNFYINSIELFTQFSFNDQIDPVITGFSGTQILLGLNLSSDLIKLK